MKRRFSLVGLVLSSTCFLFLAGVWFVLNQLRREYYNAAMDSPFSTTSPYWAMVRVQDYLFWPIVISFGCAALMFLFESAHFVAAKTAKKIGGKSD